MDLASVSGILLGVFAVFGGGVMEGIHIQSLLQFTAFIIVLGGSVGAMLLSTPVSTLKLGLKLTKDLFIFNPNEGKTIADEIIKYAEIARKESLLAMEQKLDEVKNPFLKRAFRCALDGYDPDTIIDIMETEITLSEEKENAAGKMYEACGGFAPTIGIIGAVLGLIHVMGRLAAGGGTDELGKGIAVAFVATIYGVGAANLLFIPFGNKMKTRASHYKKLRQMMLTGVLGIVHGLNPRIIQEKIRSYYE